MTTRSLLALAGFATNGLAAPAAENWENHCAKCHGADGKALPQADLTNPELIAKYPRSLQLLAMLRKDINGQPHMGDNPLPSPQEAAEIATYLREGGQDYDVLGHARGAPAEALEVVNLDVRRAIARRSESPERFAVASADGKRLYAGGSFTRVNGSTANRIVALDPTTGAERARKALEFDTVLGEGEAARKQPPYYLYGKLPGDDKPK